MSFFFQMPFSGNISKEASVTPPDRTSSQDKDKDSTCSLLIFSI